MDFLESRKTSGPFLGTVLHTHAHAHTRIYIYIYIYIYITLPPTLEQATKAQRRNRGIALLFNHGSRYGWVINDTLRPLYSRERHGTHCTGSWVEYRAGWTGAENLAPTGIRSPYRPARSE
jgi:hypothetical protein